MKGTENGCLNRMRRSAKICHILDSCEVLTIGEISMLSAETFNLASRLLCGYCDAYSPMEGYKLLVAGDFSSIRPCQQCRLLLAAWSFDGRQARRALAASRRPSSGTR
jgi:hypothetical protein